MKKTVELLTAILDELKIANRTKESICTNDESGLRFRVFQLQAELEKTRDRVRLLEAVCTVYEGHLQPPDGDRRTPDDLRAWLHQRLPVPVSPIRPMCTNVKTS